MANPHRFLTSVGKFYFLEYFYALLKSTEKYTDYFKIFDSFKQLKEQYLLGESKYKKFSVEAKDTSAQSNRYQYTFFEVLVEALGYDLINRADEGGITLTSKGKSLLHVYETKGILEFNFALFPYLEGAPEHHYKFLIEFCYKANKTKNGLLIFPVYSPLKLGMIRREIATTEDLFLYIEKLNEQLEEDCGSVSV